MKCESCGKKIEDDKELCKTCLAFYLWKFKGNREKVDQALRERKVKDNERS